MRSINDLFWTHENISAAQPEEIVSVESELAARGSAWSQVLKAHNVCMSMLLAGAVAGK
jgi:hypothetical protein